MIESHVVVEGSVSGTRQNFTYEFYYNSQLVATVRKLLPIGFDTNADALSMYAQIWEGLQSEEISEAFAKVDNREDPDYVAVYNTQPDFDRRVLGYIMTREDPHKVNACLPFWSAAQSRNGNNAAQRAAALGVTSTEYELVADRMNSMFGVSSFLADDLVNMWPEVREDWE